MKVFIETYGCQANISDSEQIAGILKNNHHEITNDEKEADAIIVNSCSVKNKTQSKILNYIKKNKNKNIFVGGCLTKTLDIKKYVPEVKAVFDTNSILKIPEIITTKQDCFSEKKEKRISAPIIRKDKNLGILVISEGCLNSCTFCATKLARGSLKSYRVGDIKRKLEIAIKEGCKKINLSSQDNGCYGFDIKTSLPELVNELTSVKGDYKIRIGMMNPWHLDKILEKLIESYKSPKVMKFLHIPVQSGSNKILKDMKRIHTVENFTKAVKEFRKLFPKISIATDVIVGYPTETEENFKKTYNLIKDIKPEVLNISTFSSRPNTDASKLKQLKSEIMKERSIKMDNLYNDYKNKKNFI
jgi:threonylcarbamoyladenosine tRNA methylthiotransferase CDKAL1